MRSPMNIIFYNPPQTMTFGPHVGMDSNGGTMEIPTKYFNPSDANIWFGMPCAHGHYRSMSLIGISSLTVLPWQESVRLPKGGVREEA